MDTPNTPFSFEMPVNNGTKNVGTLEVSGKVLLRKSREHEVDYDTIKYNGVDILPFLDNFYGTDETLQHIYSAAMNHIANTFTLENAA